MIPPGELVADELRPRMYWRRTRMMLGGTTVRPSVKCRLRCHLAAGSF